MHIVSKMKYPLLGSMSNKLRSTTIVGKTEKWHNNFRNI